MCSGNSVWLEWVSYTHLVDGSNPSRSTNLLKSHYSSMAEQLSCKQQVFGSNPNGGSTIDRNKHKSYDNKEKI